MVLGQGRARHVSVWQRRGGREGRADVPAVPSVHRGPVCVVSCRNAVLPPETRPRALRPSPQHRRGRPVCLAPPGTAVGSRASGHPVGAGRACKWVTPEGSSAGPDPRVRRPARPPPRGPRGVRGCSRGTRVGHRPSAEGRAGDTGGGAGEPARQATRPACQTQSRAGAARRGAASGTPWAGQPPPAGAPHPPRPRCDKQGMGATRA